MSKELKYLVWHQLFHMFSTYNLKIIIITSKQNSIEATIIRHSQKIPEGVHLMNN